MAMLTPEEALQRYRSVTAATPQAERDWLANEFRAANRTGMMQGLKPEEQMQLAWLQSQTGRISGNQKDDRIKKIRRQSGMANEYFADPENKQGSRYIVRNKISDKGKADGLTSGDVFEIGQYTQRDTGKDDGLMQQLGNKMAPGFDMGDVTSIPGIDWIALAAAPFTGGVSTAVLEGLKMVEQGKLTPQGLAAIAAPFGGWQAIGKSLGSMLPPGATTLPTWAQNVVDYGKQAYDTVSQSDIVQGVKGAYDTIANSDIVQGGQDILKGIREFTDPVESIVDSMFPEQTQGQQYASLQSPFARKPFEPVDLLPLSYTETWNKYS